MANWAKEQTGGQVNNFLQEALQAATNNAAETGLNLHRAGQQGVNEGVQHFEGNVHQGALQVKERFQRGVQKIQQDAQRKVHNCEHGSQQKIVSVSQGLNDAQHQIQKGILQGDHHLQRGLHQAIQNQGTQLIYFQSAPGGCLQQYEKNFPPEAPHFVSAYMTGYNQLEDAFINCLNPLASFLKLYGYDVSPVDAGSGLSEIPDNCSCRRVLFICLRVFYLLIYILIFFVGLSSLLVDWTWQKLSSAEIALFVSYTTSSVLAITASIFLWVREREIKTLSGQLLKTLFHRVLAVRIVENSYPSRSHQDEVAENLRSKCLVLTALSITVTLFTLLIITLIRDSELVTEDTFKDGFGVNTFYFVLDIIKILVSDMFAMTFGLWIAHVCLILSKGFSCIGVATTGDGYQNGIGRKSISNVVPAATTSTAVAVSKTSGSDEHSVEQVEKHGRVCSVTYQAESVYSIAFFIYFGVQVISILLQIRCLKFTSLHYSTETAYWALNIVFYGLMFLLMAFPASQVNDRIISDLMRVVWRQRTNDLGISQNGRSDTPALDMKNSLYEVQAYLLKYTACPVTLTIWRFFTISKGFIMSVVGIVIGFSIALFGFT